MMSPDWKNVIALASVDPFTFLAIEENDGMSQQCGLIRSIFNEGDNIVFEMIWMGRRPARGEWSAFPITFLRVKGNTRREYDRDGVCAFLFRIPDLGLVRVYRNNTINLDPAEIKGLDPLYVRKTRAIVYGLNENADWPAIIDRVVKDLGGDGLTSIEEQHSIQEEAERFAA